jgi:hypothetical protein
MAKKSPVTRIPQQQQQQQQHLGYFNDSKTSFDENGLLQISAGIYVARCPAAAAI